VTTTPVAAVGELSHKQVQRVLSGLMAGMFLAAVESTIVATAAPTIVEDLGGIKLLTWVFTAYMVSTTVSAALWGKLSDLIGRRTSYLAAISIFVMGSLLAGLSVNMGQLIACRGLQGLGGGGMTTLSFTIMGDILSPRKRGRYIGYFSATFATGSVVGPLAGGLLVEWFHWRAIFLLNIPLGLGAALIASSALRGVGGRRKAKLDIAGALTLTGAIVSLLLIGVWGGNKYAWGSSRILGFAVTGVVLVVLFVFIEQRAAEPVIALRLLRNRALMLASAIGALTSVIFNGGVAYLPLFLQTVRGMSPGGSAWQFAPLMVMMSLGSIACGRRVSKTGKYKRLLYLGIALSFGDAIWLSTIGPHTSTLTVVLMMLVLGFGFGLSAPIVNLVAQNAAPLADLGAASSAMVTLRSLGSTLGIGAVGSILFARLRTGVAALPGGAGLDSSKITSGPAAIRALPDPLRTDVLQVMSHAIGRGLALGIPLLVVAFAFAVWLPERPLRDHTSIEIS
jgi:EmrB/QacA subfamily drug resistance transporter